MTGFHKRKVARKKKGRDDFEKKLKEEKKRIKTEVRYFISISIDFRINSMFTVKSIVFDIKNHFD